MSIAENITTPSACTFQIGDAREREAALRRIAFDMEPSIRDACTKLALVDALLECAGSLGVESDFHGGLGVTIGEALEHVREVRELWRGLFDLTVKHEAHEASLRGHATAHAREGRAPFA